MQVQAVGIITLEAVRSARRAASGTAEQCTMSEDAEEDEVVLELDEGGRAAIGGKVDSSTCVLDDCFSSTALPALVADCQAAYLKFTSRTRVRGIKYTTNATYWMAADGAPRGRALSGGRR